MKKYRKLINNTIAFLYMDALFFHQVGDDRNVYICLFLIERYKDLLEL